MYITIDHSEEELLMLDLVEEIKDPVIFGPIMAIILNNAHSKEIPIANEANPLVPYIGHKFKDRYYIFFFDRIYVLKKADVSVLDRLDNLRFGMLAGMILGLFDDEDKTDEED